MVFFSHYENVLEFSDWGVDHSGFFFKGFEHVDVFFELEFEPVSLLLSSISLVFEVFDLS